MCTDDPNTLISLLQTFIFFNRFSMNQYSFGIIFDYNMWASSFGHRSTQISALKTNHCRNYFLAFLNLKLKKNFIVTN